MRLEFRILWFENQLRDVRTQLEEIEDHIKDVGFIPTIVVEENASNLPALARQQQLYDDFDLVVVDYDLGQPPGKQGDHVAREVRRFFGFTDIIFYSGKPTVDLRKLVHDQQIDGVYCFERPNLADRLGTHIDQVVRRLSRLEGMRGLAMATVGKCDDELRGFLAEEHARVSADRQDWIVHELDTLVANSAQSIAAKYAKCVTFEDRLASRAVTSFHLQKLVRAILKGDTAVAAKREILGQYEEQVLARRNTLGHAIESRGATGWEVTSRGTPSITTADFPQLRKHMAHHFTNIGSLRTARKGEG